MIEALTVFALVNLLDWFVTAYALREGIAQEANPIARFIYNKLGVAGLFGFKQIAVGIIAILGYIFYGLDFESAIWLYNAVFSFVVGWNSIVIFRKTKH